MDKKRRNRDMLIPTVVMAVIAFILLRDLLLRASLLL